MQQVFYLLLVSLFLAACQDDREKAATAFCHCFEGNVRQRSPAFKQLMRQVAHSKMPQKTLREGLARMDEETGQATRQQLFDLEKEGAGNVCEEAIREFKIRGQDEAERIQLLHEAMKKEPGCEVLSGLYALVIEAQTKPTIQKRH